MQLPYLQGNANIVYALSLAKHPWLNERIRIESVMERKTFQITRTLMIIKCFAGTHTNYAFTLWED